MNPLAIVKLVKGAKDIYDYVYKENDADKKLENIVDEIISLNKKVEGMKKKITKLEKG